MTKPEVVTHEQLTNPAGEQSAGMARGQAFAHDGVWCGYADIPGGASTGWHHHGDYATYSYITDGEMTVEFGPGGQEMVVARAGDSVYIPAHLVHRETVVDSGGAGFLVRTGGTGATVHNVDGPDTTPGTAQR
ncbi:cupin domain-containing protein [Actinomycetospora lutea]|uniref:cupin domain-containing protein n=1 Tax=Actinomycetospora lutea TaxID=663604 RepID=UPI0023659771|nr:cupin domain-containing protein [Actinomycetospora lutea]MDD7942841.1 cupin domain-containing protein [Actinomycetospora lutea]